MTFLDHFKKITQIPHGSHDTALMRAFLEDWAAKMGFSTTTDSAGNIYGFKGAPKICLQAHYDMVCVGLAPDIKMIEENGILRADNSSLGADNGIGIAIIMQMMGEFSDFEFIFTNDEEVGMQGASCFTTQLKSDKLLNLDSEDETHIIVGCAASVDIILSKKSSILPRAAQNAYKLSISGLPGGHSGIQIHENRPNAIKILAGILEGAQIISATGGERRNSIPTAAHAITATEPDSHKITAATQNLQKSYPNAKITLENATSDSALQPQLTELLNTLPSGVLEYNDELKIPQTSINLSTLNAGHDGAQVVLMARSMSCEGLEMAKNEVRNIAQKYGFECEFDAQSAPWTPQPGPFSALVLSTMQKHTPNAHINAVHAGLECGILMASQDKKIEACSIGPNIHSPHSTAESLELASAHKIAQIVGDILRAL